MSLKVKIMTIADPLNSSQTSDRSFPRKPLEEPKPALEEIDLQKYWLVLRRRWPVFLAVFLAFVIPGVLLTLRQRPNYEAMGKLQFQSSRVPSLTGVGERIGELEALEMQGNPLNTEAVVVQSLPVLQEAINNLGLKDKEGKPMDAVDLAKQLKVEPILRADVLEVSYKTNDPKLAAEVVNQVMKAYMARNILMNRAQAISAGDFISKQLPRARAEVDRIAEELRRFREQNRIINLERETMLMAENVARLDEQLNTTQANLAEMATQAATLRQRLRMSSDRALDMASLSQVKAVQDTMGELQAARRKLATERTRFTDGHPTIAILEDQISELNGLLQQQVAQTVGPNSQVAFGDLQIGETKQAVVNQLITAEANQLGLERKVEALTALRNAYRRRTDVIPNLGKRQEELERDLKVAQETYEGLLGRLQQIRVAENQNVGNARVIQEAVIPKDAARSSKKLILGGSVFLGIMLG
ncbi:MAG: GumC family protein, partial [Leptolyngbyaceae cyanobacterium bins.59]|nr:GumC family protein [Leptolyngbyaceae cyanobacterium bins.59]